MMKTVILFFLYVCGTLLCGQKSSEASPFPQELKVTGPFVDGNLTTGTCENLNYHPTISWSEVPSGTKAIAIFLVERGRNPNRPLYRSGVVNIDPLARSVEGPQSPQSGSNLNGGTVLLSDLDKWFGPPRYSGPCPKDGKTSVVEFRVYALSQGIGLSRSVPPRPSASVVGDSLHRGFRRKDVLAFGSVGGKFSKKVSRAQCTGSNLRWVCVHKGGGDCYCRNRSIAY